MSQAPSNSDFVNGSAFFGFMGVSLALVLASNFVFMQTWEQHTEPLKQEPESAAFQFGDLP